MEKDEWISRADVVKSGKYEKIALKADTFDSYSKRGYFERKEVPTKGANKKVILYKKSDLDAFLQLVETLENDYVTISEAFKLLGWESFPKAIAKRMKLVTILHNDGGIGYKYFEYPVKCNHIYINKEQLLNFIDTHISYDEVMTKYNVNLQIIQRWEKRHKIKTVRFSTRNYFYKSEDVDNYFNIYKRKENHYTLDKAAALLGCNSKLFYKIRKEENIESVIIDGEKYISSNEDIERLLEKMKEIREKYCSFKDVLSICNLKAMPFNIKGRPASALSRLTLSMENGGSIYLLEEIYTYKEQQEEQENIKRALDKEPLEAFKHMLSIKKVSFSENSLYTEKEWYSYCEEKLTAMRGGKRHKANKIIQLIDCSSDLSELTNKKELYSFSSNDINLNLFNPPITVAKQIHFYGFLLRYHGKLTEVLLKEKKQTKLFNMSRIINPHAYEREEKPKELYQHSEYVDIYDYAQQMTHKQKAISDAENIISGKGKVVHYASSWLYVLTHLGNAWRHGDVVSLPMVDLTGIGLSSLETLKQRDLTTQEANSIVNQIKSKDLMVNKTNAINRFNCPDNLILPFATAAAIGSLIVMGTRGIIVKEKGDEINDSMIDFGIRDNTTFSLKAHNAFFSNFGKEDFEFQSLKMNRTVLVLMYMVLVRKGRSSSALELAQKLRAHEDFESTNIYLVIPNEELDKLCESLFNRKQFGYIPDLMATILLGDTDGRDKRTREILALTSTFGSVLKLEATAGFINKTLADRKRVADEIFEMGLDKVTDLKFDLQVGALPSHSENIQCLFSECRIREMECKDCPYGVMNFYAIASLVEGIKTTIIEFVREFESDTFEGEKTRLMNVLYKDMDNLERAMQKFGEETVFNFFKGGKEEYNALLDLLDEVQSRTGEDIEKYLTYNPVYLA